jgi:hypothetical protein
MVTPRDDRLTPANTPNILIDIEPLSEVFAASLVKNICYMHDDYSARADRADNLAVGKHGDNNWREKSLSSTREISPPSPKLGFSHFDLGEEAPLNDVDAQYVFE